MTGIRLKGPTDTVWVTENKVSTFPTSVICETTYVVFMSSSELAFLCETQGTLAVIDVHIQMIKEKSLTFYKIKVILFRFKQHKD